MLMNLIIFTTDDGTAKNRLDVWLRNEEQNILGKVSFWLEDRVMVGNNSGKTQFINHVGITAWGIDANTVANDSNLEWFNSDDMRECLVGEGLLYEFLAAWTNIDQRAEGSEIKLSTSTSDIITNNDVEELNTLTQELDRGVRVLLGVRDGKYQDIYPDTS